MKQIENLNDLSEEIDENNCDAEESNCSHQLTRLLDNFFQIMHQKNTIKEEILAGIATFLSMAYAIAINPVHIQATGNLGNIRTPALILATTFGAFTRTILLAF
jgi:xanthine/uracil/vitamin C permease (AzgA family)